MPIGPGSRLGPYEVTALIGEGGMGTVWQAHHTALKRDDALKVLPEAFAADLERLARFRREAQVLASLNHPNIAHVYGLEQSDGVQALVMELVEGPTLADRIAQGPIPVDEALPIAKQIAEALEAAHEQGIIHRDLKPANIKLRPDGTVKVLDFGLAKALEPMTAAGVDATASPTITSPAMMTGVGVLLGTAAYISPEQARGKAVDKRTDIWAFGCVLYEMVTGQRAFRGQEVSDTLAAILKEQPDWTVLPAALPGSVRVTLARCLAKDAGKRWHHIADVRIEIESSLNESPSEAVSFADARTLRLARRRTIAIGMAVAGSAIVASIATWWLGRGEGSSSPLIARATISLPEDARFSPTGAWTAANLAISRDGRNVVYTGLAGDTRQLYVRRLDRPEVVKIAGTTGALNPFFSADGRWIGFFADGKLKKVQIGGSTPLTICDAAFGFGATWSEDGMIVFGGSLEGGLSLVSDNGGQPQSFTKVSKGEVAHRWPTFIPGTREVLFAIASEVTSWSTSRIAIQSLGSEEHHVVLDGGTMMPQVFGNQIIFARGGALHGVSFDRVHQAILGSPVELLQGVSMDVTIGGAAQYALSPNGTLVYLPGGLESTRRSLVWVDRSGDAQPLPVAPRGFERPRISPDGQQVTFTIREDDADIWTLSLERHTLTRLTYENGEDESPVWTPDGKRVTYSSSRGQSRLTFWKSSDGGGPEEQLFSGERHQHLSGWTPDGETLLTEEGDTTVRDVGDLFEGKIGEKTATRLYLRTPFNKRGASLSPNGRWVAYATDESGRNDIYVQPFHGEGQRRPISTDGGMEPVWARNGRELFYRNGNKLMAVDVDTGLSFRAGTSRMLFEREYARLVWGETNYDVSSDGRRFLMIKGENETPNTDLQLILNWSEELKRLVPVN
jgi:eukaryotic-like serine/threonine-protein kinase